MSHDQKPEIEGWVAALFMDLIDDNGNYEKGDETHYSGSYVAGVFRSCEVKGKFLWVFPDWKDRDKASDIVWCLEEYVHKPTHREVFPNTSVPDTAKHRAKYPSNWHRADIQSTWLHNLK